MINIDELKFDERGLIPAIVVDSVTKKVLTLAYMNRESLQISMERGLTCFWSRSREELWLKGETSGNYQHIVSITADCDGDALTVVVDKALIGSELSIRKHRNSAIARFFNFILFSSFLTQPAIRMLP